MAKERKRKKRPAPRSGADIAAGGAAAAAAEPDEGGDAAGGPPAGSPAGSGPVEPPPPGVELLTRVNRAVGFVEHLLLALWLAGLIAIGTTQALAAHIFKTELTWSAELIRYQVFFIAMLGAALAAQQLRMISMDVVTRMLSPRTRAIVRVGVSILVVLLSLLLIKVGLEVRAGEMGLQTHAELIGPEVGYLALPVGAALIGFHYLVHGAIDLSYLIRGRTPPEQAEAKVH